MTHAQAAHLITEIVLNNTSDKYKIAIEAKKIRDLYFAQYKEK
jgi:hypothetical protein